MVTRPLLLLLMAGALVPARASADDDGITAEGMAMMSEDAAADQVAALEGRWRVLIVPDRDGGGTAANHPNSVVTPGPGGEDGGGICLLPLPDPSRFLWTVSGDHSGVQARRGALTIATTGALPFPLLYGYVRSGFDLTGKLVSSGSEPWWVFLSATGLPPGGGNVAGSANWFRLSGTADGHLEGIRRYLGWNAVAQAGGGTAQVPCFYDFRVTGTRLTPADTADRLRALGYQ